MLTVMPAHYVFAQALVEHGLLDSIAAGVANARYRLELYVGEGNSIYVLAVAVVLFAIFFFRRRR